MTQQWWFSKIGFSLEKNVDIIARFTLVLFVCEVRTHNFVLNRSYLANFEPIVSKLILLFSQTKLKENKIFKIEAN